ncbi:hypothetical protein QFZ77_001650 [Paenibacillus sp. V4I3]|nr:hypothetical protein [Paenibacillus sp. V4I3]MDQ0891091.1 hypothetical protein [Paenibacillus sp. V4I9]
MLLVHSINRLSSFDNGINLQRVKFITLRISFIHKVLYYTNIKVIEVTLHI